MAKGCLEVASSNYCRETVKYGIVGINDGIISTEIAPFGGTKESSIGPIWRVQRGLKYGIEEFLGDGLAG